MRFRAWAGAACAIVGSLGEVLAGIKAAAESGVVGLGDRTEARAVVCGCGACVGEGA